MSTKRAIRWSLAGLLLSAAVGFSQPVPLLLPQLSVDAARVANEDPVGTFAMPVSALRFEPLVDVQARNFAEGQADVAIRGGLFEQSGFRLGALSLYDPQTGHYFAEIPVSPALLGPPKVLTGYENAARGWNAGAGTIAFTWRPIRTGGAVALSVGEDRSNRAELYQAHRSALAMGGRTLGADASFSFSESDGSVVGGDHRFRRVNLRAQLAGDRGQTDLFAGYQAKFFGWPNLYTPFNSFESENLQTVLIAANHREDWGQGDFFEVGGYYRRNKDDYAFNRYAPVGPVHPFQHTTWVYSIGGDVRRTAGDLVWTGNAVAVTDELRSTSLTSGRYRERSHVKLGIAPERTWTLRDGRRLTARAGLTYNDTNRDGSAVSPLAELALDRSAPSGGITRVHLGFATVTQTATYTALNSAAGGGLFRGNPNLGRQTARTLELGAAGTWDRWTATAAVFHRDDDQLVDWTYRRGVTARTANPVDLATSGFEVVARRATRRVDLVIGYTFFSKDADYGAATVDASFYALNYPRHRVTLAATARLGGGWELRLDNEARLQADNGLRRRGGDEAVISALGVYFSPRSVRGLKFSVQVDNLWDENFEEVPAVPAGRRQLSAGLTYVY